MASWYDAWADKYAELPRTADVPFYVGLARDADGPVVEKVSFDELQLAVPTQPVPWIGSAHGPLCAGVNSFGFGGTNASLIMQRVANLVD